MKYQQVRKQTGAWARASEIKSGTTCKIVSETTNQPSSFTNKDGTPKTQDVCKVKFDGQAEALNVSLNRATLGALIEAFGEESVGWQNKKLTAETEKMRVGGKAVVAMYLIPEGFKRIDDENGYACIIKDGEAIPVIQEEIPVINEDEIDIKSIPF